MGLLRANVFAPERFSGAIIFNKDMRKDVYMRKRAFANRIFAVLLVIAMTVGVCGCTNQEINDEYKNFYEIFVYSYADGNGDGIGDFRGLTEKLDYLNDGKAGAGDDLEVNAIWLMPIMPSTTYHKYDVVDYYNIDPEYGTMEDFEAFMDACEARNIEVIIDLVANHTSSEHPWFKEACSYIQNLTEGVEPNKVECQYFDYYNFTKEQHPNYYQVPGTDWYYEAQFWDGMPDLNLYSDYVQQELLDIANFWLDKGVYGFRMDACGEFYTDHTKESIHLLSTFVSNVKEKYPDCYLVGEIWDGMETYTAYYESGIDSVFDFEFSGVDGFITDSLRGVITASQFGYEQQNIQQVIRSYSETALDAPFFTNHDMPRGAGYFAGDNGDTLTKMAIAMNQFMWGNSFLYYGEELGMKGSGKDENKRAPMQWTTEDSDVMCDGPKDMDSIKMKYGSLEEQMKDPDSIYHFTKSIMKLKNQYPSIARGTVTFEASASTDYICTIKKEWNDETIAIVYNFSEEVQAADISSIWDGKKEIAEYILTDRNQVVFEEDVLEVPGHSILIIK